MAVLSIFQGLVSVAMGHFLFITTGNVNALLVFTCFAIAVTFAIVFSLRKYLGDKKLTMLELAIDMPIIIASLVPLFLLGI